MSVNGVVTLPSAMPPFSVSDIRKRTHAIQEVMMGVMKENTHYGTIPGTAKPSLWKAGAEVLCMTFRLSPILDSRPCQDDLEVEWSYQQVKRDGIFTGTTRGFFEIESICTIQTSDGQVLSRCSARCNNREAKYRSLSLFDIRNTVQKMAEKRAFVSAVLMATGASDIFTQDIEDFPELLEPAIPVPRSIPPPKSGQGLTPKREAWLFRSAQEANLPKEVLEKCLEFLRKSPAEKVKSFFDDLAKRKNVFAPFMVTAA